MAYSDFDLKTVVQTVVQTFKLTERRDVDLFADVTPLAPSDYLRRWLDAFAPVALGINTEMARSVYVIAPILADAKLHVGNDVNVLPGVTFDVDRAQGLNGSCDFLLVRSAEIYYVQAPVLAVVEAKREDMIAGLGQCVAAMVAVAMFNEREKTPVNAVHGAVTMGNIWHFLRLEGSKLTIDATEYYLRDVSKILGILVNILKS